MKKTIPILLIAMSISFGCKRQSEQDIVAGCISQMVNLSTAAQDYIVENGNLSSISSYEELCIYMYAGIKEPSECAELLNEHINRACKVDSFSFEHTDTTYEFKAISNNADGCFVCATENYVVPDDLPSLGCNQKSCKH